MRALGKCEINRMKKRKKRSRKSHGSKSSLLFSLSLSLPQHTTHQRRPAGQRPRERQPERVPT